MRARQKANFKLFKQQSKAKQELFDLPPEKSKGMRKLHNLIQFSQLSEQIKHSLLNTISAGPAHLRNLHTQLQNSIANIHQASANHENMKVFMFVVCCIVCPPLALGVVASSGPRREDAATYTAILAAVEEALHSYHHDTQTQILKPNTPQMLRK